MWKQITRGQLRIEVNKDENEAFILTKKKKKKKEGEAIGWKRGPTNNTDQSSDIFWR